MMKPLFSLTSFYRSSLKAIHKLQDPGIRNSLKSKLRTELQSHKYSKRKSPTILMQEHSKIFTKFLSRCLQKHQNSLSQLVRIHTNTTPLEHKQYMTSKPKIELESDQEFKKLSSEDKNFVRMIVLKCCEKPDLLFNSLTDYLKDARSEEAWDWRKIPYVLDQKLVEEIQKKVDNSLPYHYQYREIFQHIIPFKKLDSKHIVDDIISSNYWIL